MGEWEIPFAETIDRAKKYVVSSTLSGVDWNAELVRGDLGEAVQRLKQEPGEGLYVGGVTLPLALADLGLIDEYEFVVQPVLAGHGPTLFAGLREPSSSSSWSARSSGRGQWLCATSPVESSLRSGALGRTRTCAHGSGGHWRRQAPISTARGCSTAAEPSVAVRGAPSAGLEPAHTAPEATGAAGAHQHSSWVLDDGAAGVAGLGRPRQDSNLRTRLRRPMLYPLSYEGVGCAPTAAGRSARSPPGAGGDTSGARRRDAPGRWAGRVSADGASRGSGPGRDRR